MYINPSLVKFKISKDEEEIKDFVKNWDKPGKLSDIGHINDNYYITLPNVISNAMDRSITRAEQLLKLNVNMDYGYICGLNWSQCH